MLGLELCFHKDECWHYKQICVRGMLTSPGNLTVSLPTALLSAPVLPSHPFSASLFSCTPVSILVALSLLCQHTLSCPYHNFSKLDASQVIFFVSLAVTAHKQGRAAWRLWFYSLTGKKSSVGQCHVHCTHGRCVSAQLLCVGVQE